MSRLLIIDDHAIVRAGIRRLLASSPDIECLEAATGEEALALLAREPIRLAILDLNLPGLGGVELIRCLLRASPRLRVLVFSTHAEPIYLAKSLEAGALGYVSKNAAPEELARAIDALRRGRGYVEADIAGDLENGDTPGETYLRPLSSRELEVMRLLARGRSLTQISTTLGIAYKTVANTCTHIKEKLGVTHTADLIRISVDRGLV
jgi:two-component system, NarL family, invasion response regulator UvrY